MDEPLVPGHDRDPVSDLPYRLSVCGKSELPQFAGRGVTHLLSLENPDVPKETPDWHTGPHAQLRFHDLVRAGPVRPDRVCELRPAVLPNPLLVGSGDELLGRDGALVRAATPLLDAVDQIVDLLAPPGEG